MFLFIKDVEQDSIFNKKNKIIANLLQVRDIKMTKTNLIAYANQKNALQINRGKYVWISLLGSSLIGLSLNVSALTLEQSVEDAVMHNPEFRQEVKQLQAINADVKGAKSGYYPKIDLSGGIGYEEVERDTFNNIGDGLNRKEASVKLTQNLFEGFGTEDEVKRQAYRRDAQAYEAYSVASDVAMNMIKSYINLIKEQKLLALAEDSLQTHLDILSQIEERTSGGISSQIEVDQVNARVSLAYSNLSAAKNNFFDTQASFSRVLGRKPESNLIQPDFNFELPKSLESALDVAMLEHPRLHSAYADIAEARMQYSATRSSFYPRLDFEIEKVLDENIAGQPGKNHYFQAMLRVNYNLYNGGADKAKRERTASQYQEATEIRNNTRRQVIENLTYAWNASKFVEEQLEYNQKNVAQTYNTLEGYREQFNLGRRSLLDLLNTENEYTTALKSQITSQADLLIAKYRVLDGTGQMLDKMKLNLGFIATPTSYLNE